MKNEKTHEGGVELRLKLKIKRHIGYPGSFELKLLQSTRQVDFASLKQGLNPLIKLDYTNTMTHVNVFLILNHNPIFSRNYKVIIKGVYKYVF